MPRKKKEEYNEYMRNYMKKKNRENKGQPVFDGDFDPSSISDGKPVLNINKTKDLIKQTEELLKNKGSETESDPILKAIDKYGKYVPLVVEFLKGLQGSVSQYNKKDLTPKIQPPEGWLIMTPMQKLNYKYSRADWYAAGEAYDIAIETGSMNPHINTSYVDPNYSAPQNLQSLSRKYPEAPLVNNSPPQNLKELPNVPVDEEENKRLPEQDNRNKSSDTENSEEKEKQETQIISELQQDNLKYINLGADFVNKLKDEEFKNHLKNIDALIEKAKPFIPLIPIQVKGMIVQTSKEDLEALFKEKCPKKYEMIVKSKKVKKLLELFDKLKKEII